MLPDNFNALNACFRDTVINILLVRWIKLLSAGRWIHGTVGIESFVSIQMHVMTGRSCIITTQVYILVPAVPLSILTFKVIRLYVSNVVGYVIMTWHLISQMFTKYSILLVSVPACVEHMP